MSALQRRKTYGPPTLGLNTRFEAGTIQDLEAVSLSNYQINETGSLSKYPGYTLDGSPFPASSDSFIRSIYNFRRGATVNQLLVAAQDNGNTNTTLKVDLKYTIGDGVYKYLTYGIGTATFTNGNTAVTGTNTSWTHELKSGDKIKLASDADSKYTEIATVNSDTSITLVGGGYLGTTAGSPSAYLARKIWNKSNIIAMTTFNNVAVIIDGNGVAQQYDATNIFGLINSYSGTTITVQVNAAPIANFVEVHKNRVFMADQTGNLFWSHAFDQTFWDPASTEPISPADGGTVVGIKSFADSLYVFKNNGFVYRVFGNFDDSAIGTAAYIQRVPYSEKIGLISNRSIIVHGNYLYFIAQTGIYTIDFRGYMQKISYIIDPTTQNLNFTQSGSIAKSFPFSTTAQWNTGTHAGTYSNSSDQQLTVFYDDYRQTDALQQLELLSISLGSDNTLHVAYVPSSNPNQINYVRYYQNGTTNGGTQIRKETNILINNTGAIAALSIAVDNSTKKVGIAYSIGTIDLYYLERSADIQSPFSYGTWGGNAVTGFSNSKHIFSLRLIFSSGGVQYVSMASFTASVANISFATKSGGTWSGVSGIYTAGYTTANVPYSNIAIDGSGNLYISAIGGNFTDIVFLKSTNGGVNWTQVDSISSQSPEPRGTLSIGFNHAGDYLTTFSDTSGVIHKRNSTTTTTSTVATLTNSYCGGWFTIYNNLDNVNLDTDNYYQVSGVPSNSNEQFTVNQNLGGGIGTTITNSNTNVILNSTTAQTFRPSQGCVTNNGNVVGLAGFGQNSHEIVLRRASFRGYWQGPQGVDTTLSSWGTYAVTGGSSGATFNYQIALSSSNPASSFSSITPGAVISSNNTLVYNIPRIEFTLTGWNGTTVTSLILNYFGAGVDSKQIYGVSFYNEAYFAGSTPGQSNNNLVIVQDIKNAFLTTNYPINCMEVFNNSLYAGSSLQGDVYILKNGFSENGSAYTSTYISKEDFLDFMELEKDFFTLYILYRLPNGGSFPFSYRIDNFITGNGTWTTTTITPTSSGIFEIPIHAGGGSSGSRGRSIQFMVQDTANNQQSEILGFVLVYGLLNLRG